MNGLWPGAWEPGGPGGPGPPLELRFYRVKIFKIGEISFFVLLGPPLGKNRSQAPAYVKGFAYVKFFNSSELPTFELTNSWNGRHNFS